MQLISLVKTLLKVSLVGPTLSLRLGEMALASMQVITYRSIGLAKPVKKSGDRREMVLMVSEKIAGLRESVIAGNKHMGTLRSPTGGVLPDTDFIYAAVSKIFSSKNPLELILNTTAFYMSSAKFLTFNTTKIILSGSDFFKTTTDPLRSRVVANARRLRKKNAGAH